MSCVPLLLQCETLHALSNTQKWTTADTTIDVPLLKTQSSQKFPPFKFELGQNLALHVLAAARNSAFLVSVPRWTTVSAKMWVPLADRAVRS